MGNYLSPKGVVRMKGYSMYKLLNMALGGVVGGDCPRAEGTRRKEMLVRSLCGQVLAYSTSTDRQLTSSRANTHNGLLLVIGMVHTDPSPFLENLTKHMSS